MIGRLRSDFISVSWQAIGPDPAGPWTSARGNWHNFAGVDSAGEERRAMKRSRLAHAAIKAALRLHGWGVVPAIPGRLLRLLPGVERTGPDPGPIVLRRGSTDLAVFKAMFLGLDYDPRRTCHPRQLRETVEVGREAPHHRLRRQCRLLLTLFQAPVSRGGDPQPRARGRQFRRVAQASPRTAHVVPAGSDRERRRRGRGDRSRLGKLGLPHGRTR